MARILVVDDDEANRILLQRLVEAEGHTVDVAASVDEAWQALANGLKPDVVFTDINMPENTGVELLFRMRKSSDLEKVPVVFATAFRDRSMAVRAADEAVLGVLDKPFEREDVLAMLEAGLGRPTGS
jgi:CheY-like chemotaxis protein